MCMEERKAQEDCRKGSHHPWNWDVHGTRVVEPHDNNELTASTIGLESLYDRTNRDAKVVHYLAF